MPPVVLISNMAAMKAVILIVFCLLSLWNNLHGSLHLRPIRRATFPLLSFRSCQ